MGTLHENEDSSFHIQLLSKIIDIDQYPVIKLIIGNNISREEFSELVHMLEMLNESYEQQKEEGFMDFTSLLVHFAGMLNEKLDPNQLIYALKKEGYFPSLMDEFVKIIKRDRRRKRKS